MSWGPEKMLIRCSNESHHPAEWASGPPVEHQENKKDTTLTAIRVEVKILKFMFRLQLPLTVEPHTTLSNPYNKVRGTYIYKEVFLRPSLLLCRYDAVDDNITLSHFSLNVKKREVDILLNDYFLILYLSFFSCSWDLSMWKSLVIDK